jgi:hypothetical protein
VVCVLLEATWCDVRVDVAGMHLGVHAMHHLARMHVCIATVCMQSVLTASVCVCVCVCACVSLYMATTFL